MIVSSPYPPRSQLCTPSSPTSVCARPGGPSSIFKHSFFGQPRSLVFAAEALVRAWRGRCGQKKTIRPRSYGAVPRNPSFWSYTGVGAAADAHAAKSANAAAAGAVGMGGRFTVLSVVESTRGRQVPAGVIVGIPTRAPERLRRRCDTLCVVELRLREPNRRLNERSGRRQPPIHGSRRSV